VMATRTQPTGQPTGFNSSNYYRSNHLLPPMHCVTPSLDVNSVGTAAEELGRASSSASLNALPKPPPLLGAFRDKAVTQGKPERERWVLKPFILKEHRRARRSTPFQPHFNPISTPFQPHFNPISTPFQPHFNASLTLF